MLIMRLAGDLVRDFGSGRRNIKAETFMRLAAFYRGPLDALVPRFRSA